MSTEDIQREQQISDEWLEDWKEASLRQLWERAGCAAPAPFDGITDNDQREEGQQQ